jgi:hypothetical protein
VGRIDFAELPAFSKTETQLLQQYFAKNVRYRTNGISLQDRATLGGFFSLPQPNEKVYDHRNDEVFNVGRANATRWFGIGPGKLVHGDIYAQTSTEYLWGFHGGPGDPQGQKGDGITFHYTTDLANATNEPRTAFYFMHGSWFSDWNLTSNNFLRATMATANYGLASVAFSSTTFTPFKMESLGLGEPLANAMLQTCSALGSSVPRWLTIIGDPTLRLKMPTPVSGFTATYANSNFTLTWNALAGAANYYVYRSSSGIDGSWTRRTITIATSYVDPGAPSNSLYMLRAALLTTTSCGSYYNLTQGVFAP